MKWASKRELVEAIEREHAALVSLAETIPRSRYREPGVWGDDWDIADLFAHLTEWRSMLLRWVDADREGRKPERPAPGFKWNETPRLNREIQRKFARRPVARVLAEYEAAHEAVLARVKSWSEAELLEPGRFAWTGAQPLASHVSPNTCSHDATARKILARWLRRQRPAR